LLTKFDYAGDHQIIKKKVPLSTLRFTSQDCSKTLEGYRN